MKRTATLAALSALFASQVKAVSQWGQCGGIGYTGDTTCDAGLVCTHLNDYYYQCLVGSTTSSTSSIRTSSTTSVRSSSTSSVRSSSTSSVRSSSTSSVRSSSSSTRTTSTSTSSTRTSSSPVTSSTGTKGKFKYFGTNISGFDFSCSIDGTCSVTGAYPPLLQYYGLDGAGQMSHFVHDDGFNTFRLPVSWQYLVNDVLGGTLDADNWVKYDALVQACLDLGAYCIVDIHNYARWNGKIIGQGGPTNEQFASLWSQIAAKYAGKDHVIFGIMNEPHDIPDISAWADSVQAAVTAIRKAGANQVCLLPGNDWTSAEKFISNGSAAALSRVTNPDGSVTNLIFDVHKYLDSDNSGTSSECTTNNISNAFQPLSDWLRANGRQAFNSETGGGNTASCQTYFCQQVAFEQANSDVIVGVTGWAAGNFYPGYVLGETPQETNGVWTDTSLVAACLVPYAPGH